AAGLVATFALDQVGDPRLLPVVVDDGVEVATLIDRTIDAGLVPLPAGIAVTVSVRRAGTSDAFSGVAQGPLGSAFEWHVEV
ncbi:hypothetical protein ABK046_50475, partial [Streptomyces caeruleatus]